MRDTVSGKSNGVKSGELNIFGGGEKFLKNRGFSGYNIVWEFFIYVCNSLKLCRNNKVE